MQKWKSEIKNFNDKWDIVVPGDFNATIQFAVNQFIEIACTAIQSKGNFSVALSGGSTPKTIFQELAKKENSLKIDWSKVIVFWSDERAVPPNDTESNYHMAMEAGFNKLPLNPQNIFRMEAEKNIEENAKKYENTLIEMVPSGSIDLIMLGMGDDGHTASLFPNTHGLHTTDKLIIANFIPQKETWRMSFAYQCINNAQNTCIYVLGSNKSDMIKTIFTSSPNPDDIPIVGVGTPSHKALWILDSAAAQKIV